MKYSQAFRRVAFLWAVLAPPGFVQAENVATLSVTPNRCIALRQGQYCYQKLTFEWQVEATQNYCLYTLDAPEPLVCWQGDKLKRYQHEFKSIQDQTFVLRDETAGSAIAEVVIDVAWVYKSSKKVSTGWRLF